MATVNIPSVSLSVVGVQQIEENLPQKVLFVGQQTSAATSSTGVLNENIGNEGEESTLFGPKSMLADGIRMFKRVNKFTQVDAIGVDDAAGTAATGTIAFTGTNATEDGTFTVYCGSRKNFAFEISVTSGDVPTAIGDALVAALAADSEVAVSGINTSGSVALTHVHLGTIGNTYGLEVQGTVAGITVAVTAMSSGATDPTITTVLNAIGDQRYQTIVWPVNYTNSVVQTFLEDRFNVTNDILDGVAIMTDTQTFADLKTNGAVYDSRAVTYFGNQLVADTLYKGSAIFEIDYNISAHFAGLRSLKFTDGASLANFITSPSLGRDAFGGEYMASFPYFNWIYEYLPTIDLAQEFTRIEMGELKDNGVSVLGNNKVRTKLISNEIMTTYRTDAAGNVDNTFKYLEYVDTISNYREFVFNNAREFFGTSRLTQGDLVPNHLIADEASVASFFARMYQLSSDEDRVWVPSGQASFKFFKDNLSVEINYETGVVTMVQVTPIVTQLRSIVGTIELTFSI